MEEVLNKLLRDTINLVMMSSGFAIKAEQKGAMRPVGPYASVSYISSKNLSTEEYEYDERDPVTDLDSKVKVSRSYMFSLSFFRDSSIDNANKTYIGMAKNTVQSMFSTIGVGLLERSPVRKISRVLEDTWEESSQFDVTVNVIETDEEIVKAICAATVSAEFQYRGLKYNFEIEAQ